MTGQETAGSEDSAPRRGQGGAHVHEVLRQEIFELRLAPGAAIDESQIAARFALSRTPVREALVRLAAEGLITVLPNRATIVSPIDFMQLPQFLDALTLMYRVTTRLAAAHHRPEDLPEIRRAQAAFAAAVARGDALKMIATNRDFHVAIALAGRNPYYTDLFTRLLDEGRRLLRLYYYNSFNDHLPPEYLAEHDAMLKAVIERDVAGADLLAAAHAEQIVRQIQTHVARDSAASGQMPL